MMSTPHPVATATTPGTSPWLLLLGAILVVGALALCVLQLRRIERAARLNRRHARALRTRAEGYAAEPTTRPLAEALHLYQRRQKTEAPLLDRLLGRPKSIERLVATRLAAPAPPPPGP